MNPDIAKERRRADFSTADLTYFLEKGKDRTERRRRIEALVYNDPQFKREEIAFMGQVERFNYSIRQQLWAVERIRELGWNNLEHGDEIRWFNRYCECLLPLSSLAILIASPMCLLTLGSQEADMLMTLPSAVHGPETPTMGLHNSMFLHCVAFQMTEEQQEKWLTGIKNYTLIGTYAQTELGHGTYVRGLETTSTYDPTTQEFVLHSPTLTSMKYWPGNLGKVVTHSIVAAKLIIRGKDYGTHMFMVQLRSLDDHTPMPGVEIGDIGPKLGYGNIDNGFLRLDRVRIPRDQMCMRFSKVEPDGTYRAPPHSKMSYSSMVEIRSALISGAGYALAAGSTIATRYSAVRRQSELIPGKPEPQIMDYQSQQIKLFPLIATAYAFLFCGQQLIENYLNFVEQAKRGDFTALPVLHSTTAGLKAFTTECCRSGLEVLRMSCGGHGYSAASAFPELYGVFAPMCTYEGENTVMLLQAARFLVKSVNQAMEGAELPPFMSYLTMDPSERCSARTPEDFTNMQLLLKAYRHRARRMVGHAGRSLAADIKKGVNKFIAWNNNHLHLLNASNAHCHLFVVDQFYHAVEDAQCEPATSRILRVLLQFYALDGILNNKGEFLESGYLSIGQIDLISKQYTALLSVIRPNAVALVDAFDIHDAKLGSVLGRYDGNVYENLYKWAKSAPLNKKDVPEAYDLYLKPFLEENRLRAQAKL